MLHVGAKLLGPRKLERDRHVRMCLLEVATDLGEWLTERRCGEDDEIVVRRGVLAAHHDEESEHAEQEKDVVVWKRQPQKVAFDAEEDTDQGKRG